MPWVHLALDPENLGAADGINFDLTVSYDPGADIDIATVVFRRVENSTGPKEHKVVVRNDDSNPEPFGVGDAPQISLQGRREVAIIMDQCKR